MENEPFNKFLDQIAEIMQFAYDNADKPIPPSKQLFLETKLESLERQVALFKEVTDQAMAEVGATDYLVEAMLDDTKLEAITEEQREVLLRAQALKEEARKASLDVTRAAMEAKTKEKSEAKKTEKPKKRSSKFKNLGGYKNWKPL